jgi:predicted unusual protein kinase regulating ubiquinone biosynthesis (AarF/ABC1/UbiB family)
MFKLAALLLKECVRYAWTRDYEGGVRRLCTDAVQLNLVYAKVVQSLVVKFGPCVDVAHHILPKTGHLPPSVRPDGFVFDPEVLGSGMVSVVYSGEFQGKKAVLKVKRRGVEDEIERGLASVKRMVWWFNLVPYFHKFELNMMYAEVESFLTEQLHLEKEVLNQERFRESFQFNPLIVVPEVYHHTPDYIIMERFFPCPLDDALKEHYAKLLCQVAIKSAVFDGFVHADLHVGNVFFLPEKKLGIIDFGLMTQLDKQQQDDYFELFSAMNQSDHPNTAVVTLERYMSPKKGADRTRALLAMEKIYEKIDQGDQGFGMREISDLMLAVYPLGYTVKPYFYKIAMSMAACDMFLKSLSPSTKQIFKDEIKAVCAFSTPRTL